MADLISKREEAIEAWAVAVDSAYNPDRYPIMAAMFRDYADEETWGGYEHPYQALENYRQSSGIDAKLIVNGMTATESSITNPSDARSLSVVGFDPAVPKLIADFSRGL